MNSARQIPGRRAAMRPENRLQFILDRLEEKAVCSYEELARGLRVSTMTIRRDLEPLVRKGNVIRTVGGIQRAEVPSSLYETAAYSRLRVKRAEKRAIARRALELIGHHATIFIDGSTTCVELARCIAKEKKGMTIVTNSALVCMEFSQSPDNTVIAIGGQYDATSLCFVGPHTEEVLKTFFFDIAFVGTKALLPAEGTFESSLPNLRVKQAVVPLCTKLVLLVDHSKMGQRALTKVIDIKRIHTVVTDSRARRQDLAVLAKAGARVCLAAPLRGHSKRTADVA
jgi:DeoR family transcriptional regulator of aga operon